MKKYASILAVLVLLLGFASLSFAVPAEIPADTTAVIAKGKTQITLGGELRFRGIYGKNLSVIEDDTYADNTANFDYRVRLNLEAKVTPNTTGYIELESGSNLIDCDSITVPQGGGTFRPRCTSRANTTDNVTWGSQNGGGRGVYDMGNTKESEVTIRQAWIQYQGTGLLGVPAGVKVGRQLVKLGYGLFYDHTYFGDDAILLFVQPMKELTLAAFHIKWSEENTNRNDDSTGNGILVAYAGKGFGLSADVAYVDHQNIEALSNADIHLWNFGLRGNVDDIAGTGLNFKADVEFQTGKIRDTSPEIKLSGWAAMAGLDYKFKTMPLSLTLEYAIGSGDKAGTADKFESFITSLGQEQHYTFIYEHLGPAACSGLFYGRNRTGLCNTQYVKFGGAYDIIKDLKAELYGYWLRAHRAVSINGYTPDKDLGFEVDAKVTYQIDKGLTYWVEGGYFWPGDAFKLPGGRDADDAWAVRHGIMLKF